MAEIEDAALERLYKRLELAIWQIEHDDPGIEWRSGKA